MAIYNPDGSKYTPNNSFSQFDPKNREYDLFNSIDQEMIEIGGTPLYYYELFINSGDIDELYVESREKVWSQNPVCLYGYYEPTPSQNFQTSFGIDSPDEMMFEFNYQHVLCKLGHAPKIGSRIFSPHKQEHWQIIQRNTESYKMWGELRLQLMCSRFQESLTTNDGKVTETKPNVDFSLNSVKDLGSKKTNFGGGQPPTCS